MANYVLACSGGGHLKEMYALASLMGIDPDEQHWATFDNALSRSLLAGRRVTYLQFAAPRSVVPTARNAAIAARMLARGGVDAVFSTGASPALSFLPLAAARSIPAHYIESAARVDGPSLSGRLVAKVPAVAAYTQYRDWADDRWRYGGAVFDRFRVEEEPVERPIRKAVVSIGTQDTYPFRRLFETLVPLLDGVEVLWQVGTTDLSEYGIQGRHSVPHLELNDAMLDADVVIAHAGVGTALSAIEVGKVPILVPRRSSFGEHVDDHQIQIAERLASLGLAVHTEADALTADVLRFAANRRVVAEEEPAPFVLQERPAGPRALGRFRPGRTAH